MRMILLLWMILVVISAVVLYAPQKEVSLRIGTIKTVDAIYPYIAAKQGYYEAEGLTYKIYSFDTSPALAEALASGEIDVAYMGFLPAAVWISKGANMKILAGASRGGDIVCARDWNNTGKIAVSSKGTMTENIYKAIVSDSTNFEPIYGINPPDMSTALFTTEGINAVLTWEPFASKIEEEGGVCIFDAGAEWEKIYGKKYQRNVLVVTDRVLTNKTLVDSLMRAHNRTIEFLNTPQADQAIAEVMGMTLFKKKRVEYTSELEWESMQKMMKIAVDDGYLKRQLTWEELVYNSG